MSVYVDRDSLNDAIDFDSPFVLDVRDQSRPDRVTLSRADGICAPTVELCRDRLLIDDMEDHPDWTPVSGHSGQYGYSGPIMHPSECLGGGMADALLLDATLAPATYVATIVEVWECDESCPDEHWDMLEEERQPDHDPAGWILLALNN